MLLRNSLLRYTLHPDLLSLPQLCNHTAQPLWIRNYWSPYLVVWRHTPNHQVPRIYFHDLVTRASCVECECDATIIAVLLTVAVAGVKDGVDVFGIQWDEAEAMGDEFVGKNRGVGFDFDKVDGHGGHFAKNNAAEGVSEGEVDISEGEVYGVLGCLYRYQSRLLIPWFVEAVPL